MELDMKTLTVTDKEAEMIIAAVMAATPTGGGSDWLELDIKLRKLTGLSPQYDNRLYRNAINNCVGDYCEAADLEYTRV
jgi:hypothetical protein